MFISLRYRPNKWPFWALVVIEFPLTVALLAFFGIAAPNLYRTKLWADGALNGFNSSPTTGLYAAANYRPYAAPKVWGQFITNFNLVISVLSMFVMLAKSAMYMLHVFPPLLSAFAHAAMLALYAVSVAYQGGSDMSDPKRPQPGPPWYISKSCSVAHDKKLVGYCMQAKAAFACSIVILVVFFFQLCLAIWSCFPSPSYRAEREAKRLARKSRWAHLDSPTSETELKFPSTSLNELANQGNGGSGVSASAAGGLNPQTPRTLAFNRLGGTKDLPLRNHFKTSKEKQKDKGGAKSPAFSSRFALRSPTFPGSPLSPGFDRAKVNGDEEASTGLGRAVLRPIDGVRDENGEGNSTAGAGAASPAGGAPGMYFPPPPKVAVKSGK